MYATNQYSQFTNNLQYVYENCSYTVIQNSPETMEQKCQTVAHGICEPTDNYLNFYTVYYCFMGGNNALYLTFTGIAVVWLLVMLNYIRRTFFVPPLMKLRKTLGISSSMTEKIILPFSFGIVPFIVRVQGSYQNLSFNFNMGATLGGMFSLSAFAFGMCSLVIGRSKRVPNKIFTFDIFYSILACVLFFVIGSSGKVHLWHGIMMIGIWLMYIISGYVTENEMDLRKNLIFNDFSR